MKNYTKSFVTIFTLVALTVAAYGKTEVSDSNGATDESSSDSVTPTKKATGEGEASKFFKKKKDKADTDTDSSASSNPEHLLAIHLGGFFSSDSYSWGSTNQTSNPGRLQGGVTYNLSPLGKAADWAIRGDFIGYQFNDGSALNFAVMPMLIFPNADTKFPIYFGIGIGPGIFFQQIDNLSSLSLNYELVGGLRFFNVIGSTGFFLESGLKNEVNLLSQGQFNGYFLSIGALFAF